VLQSQGNNNAEMIMMMGQRQQKQRQQKGQPAFVAKSDSAAASFIHGHDCLFQTLPHNARAVLPGGLKKPKGKTSYNGKRY
jgi:hypothetical protein